MPDETLQASQALDLLLSRFRNLGDRQLKAVWQKECEACVDSLMLDFGSALLTIRVNPDDDTLSFSVNESLTPQLLREANEISHSAPWAAFIGKSFGWGWLALNQQGYPDMLLLSFESVVFPEVVVNVVASSIKIGTVSRHK
jgi:hypothetical protein